MNSSDADRQIKQMVNFILQEAHEKANEIRIKTEHDFNLEKQMLVHHAKLKIQDEYTRKTKERQVNKRIAHSTEIGESRRKKMIVREELLQQLEVDASKSCNKITKDNKRYEALMAKLMVQGMIKLFEEDITLRCREADIALVKKLIPNAIEQCKKVVQDEVNVTMDFSLQVAENKEILLPASCAGGIVAVGHGGKIICDNTLDTRLKQVNYDLKPQIRQLLFPTMN